MISNRDKDVIGHWLALYNRLNKATFAVESWPDDDSSKENVDAICRNNDGRTIAIEHTLVEAFENEKSDADRFLRTLGSLENNPALVEKGYSYLVSQPVDSIPTGINWNDVPRLILKNLPDKLSALTEGSHVVAINDLGLNLNLHIQKMRTSHDDLGKFLTGRVYPGDPGNTLILSAIRRKAPKLSRACADKKILLLEKDSPAGTIESQFALLPDDSEVRNLLRGMDEVWAANTVGLQSENVIFTNQVFPVIPDNSSYCSLDVVSGKFWQVTR